MKLSFTPAAMLTFGLLYMAGANPVPDRGPATELPPPFFVCNDNNLAKKCMGDPYHQNCTQEAWVNYDAPLAEYSDKTKCSCEVPSFNTRAC
ncbi:hypothetical protein B0T14DRAFT_570754 [Immersiella caudata]|uniref:Uncharacterized protein n=1 Tax=Immersiella caudata TaxID=314043 RepID=A0AA39TMT7_9PEZI|nr:hypothetical protein B0T14DRAFT_570754 [Immersiella caudata]